MNRARRKTHKTGRMKRLVNESLVLSGTRFVSSHVVRFFETGLASPILKSAKKTDDFVRDKITGPLFKKTELRKNITQPLRNLISLLFSRSVVFGKLCELRTAALNATLRSIGIFLITFGVYAAAMFFAKHYMALTLGSSDTNDLIFAAITFIVGLILTVFGDKSILSSVGTSRIVGTLLDTCLGINESSFNTSKKTSSRTAASVSFLLGSIFGILTLFYSPLNVICACAAFLMFVAVMNIPEFGLMSIIFTVPFAPVELTALLCVVTVASYTLKCLRLKRNFRFGSADAVVLVLFALVFLASIASDGGMNKGKWYLLSFFAIYFLAKNLISSERLLSQTFNSLTSGLRIGMILYVLGEYAMYIPHELMRETAFSLSENIFSPDMLVIMAVVTLPFSFSLCAKGGRKRREIRTFLLVAITAILIDSFVFYSLALISLFIYVMMAYKAPAGALLGGTIVLLPAFVIISKLVSSSAIPVGNEVVYDSVLGFGEFEGSVNYWSAFVDINGVLCAVVFAVAVILVIHRVLGCMAINGRSEASRGCGTVLASAIMMLVCSLLFNPFADLRIIAVMWFVLGLCGSVYAIYTNPKYSSREV